LPSTSIDTFFACTIIVAIALIATAFLTTTMQTSINGTQDINKDSYLQAIADHIVTSPGAPVNWGESGGVPEDFGLAAASSTNPYELDLDKVTRLNGLNNYSLSYFNLANSAQLSNIALGITVSQIMTINIEQTSSITAGDYVSNTFTVLTSINSEPTSASLSCYVEANNYLTTVAGNTSGIGVGSLTVQIPTGSAGNALLVVFARASFDDRVTSYAIYNFADSAQESAPSNDVLTLTPLDFMLSYTTNATDLTFQDSCVFSFAYQQNLTPLSGTNQYVIPSLADTSPLVIVVSGYSDGTYFQEWTSYPQVPLTAGSSFQNSEQNVFSYIVTINGVLYKVDVSFGDVVS
jgi:hypothetical protein